jgi:ParB/RepB/Spo0J family partition protein
MSSDLNLSGIDNLSLMLGDSVEVLEINITDIIPDPNQPRKERNQESDKELSQSIKEKGVLQAIVVRPKDDLGKHMIAFGHRRYDASILAKKKTIPCVVKEIDTEEILSIQVIENIQRDNMSLADEIESISKVVEQYGVKETARILGKKSQYISKRVRVNKSKQYILDFIKMKFSNDMSAYYELALLESKYPSEAKELVDDWILSPYLRTSLRNQIEEIKKKLSLENKKENITVSIPTTKEKIKIEEINSIKEIESIVSVVDAKTPKNDKKIKPINVNAEPDSFEIKAIDNETLLSFKFDDGEKIDIKIDEDLWSKFVDEINRR